MTFKFEEGKDHGKFNGTENQFKIVGEKRERRERDMRAGGGEIIFIWSNPCCNGWFVTIYYQFVTDR